MAEGQNLELARRLVTIFVDREGRRAVFGANGRFQGDSEWHDLIPFYEYFNGDTAAGVGASHQTGWTGLVAELVIQLNQRSHPESPPPAGD